MVEETFFLDCNAIYKDLKDTRKCVF